MIKNKDFKDDFKKKIIIILACLGLVTSNITIAHVDAAAGAGAITMGVASQTAGAGLGISAAAAAPYVVLAAAIVGTGVLIYENGDEIVAVAQYLYNTSSSVMKSLIERAYDAKEGAIIMTSTIRNFIVSSAEKLINLFNSPDPTITASLISGSYASIPAMYNKIPIEDMRDSHIEGMYNGYIGLAFGSKIYYITGIRDLSTVGSSLSSEAIFDATTNKAYMNILGVGNLRAEKIQTAPTVLTNIYEYDTISDTYTRYENSRGATFEDGVGITINATTPTNSKVSTIRSITFRGLENVLGIDGYLDSEQLNDLVISNGFGLTNEIRTFTGDYSPGKTVEVNVGDMLVNPGLNAEEMEDNLEVAFPTMSGSIALDMDVPISGVGADDLSDVMLDTGIVAVPGTAIGVKPGELAQSKTDIATGVEALLPSVFPKAKNALTGLENVREEPPVININLNEIFTASTKEVSPGLESPFEEGESVFFDFSDLNRYRFGGKPLIEYMRMIIGFGFIFSTFLYIWKKFTVTTT